MMHFDRFAKAVGLNPVSAPIVLMLLAAATTLGIALSGVIPLWIAALLHLACVGATAALAWPTDSDDAAWMIAAALSTACAGPFGAGFCLLALALKSRLEPAELEAWYKRVDATVALRSASEAIEGDLADGRAISPNAENQVNFHATIERGALVDKQALLGLIGLKYHESYYPILRRALKSPEATVRVQAAAVYAKLKEQHKTGLRRAVRDAATAVDDRHRLNLIASIDKLVSSELLDAAEVRCARETTRKLCLAVEEASPGHHGATDALIRLDYAEGNYEAVVDRIALSGSRPGNTDIHAAALLRLGRTREFIVVNRTNSAEGDGSASMSASTGRLHPVPVRGSGDEPGDRRYG